MKKVAGLRVMCGLKQSDVSQMLGISRQSYSEKERGNIPFKDSEKILLRSIFRKVQTDITIDDIFFS